MDKKKIALAVAGTIVVVFMVLLLAHIGSDTITLND